MSYGVPVLASEDGQEAWPPSLRCILEPLVSGQRQGWKPPEDPRTVHCWEISLG